MNIATTVGGLMANLKNIDVLDCVAVYCRCDPKKEGVVKSEALVVMLEHKMNDVKNFTQGQNLKLKKN